MPGAGEDVTRNGSGIEYVEPGFVGVGTPVAGKARETAEEDLFEGNPSYDEIMRRLGRRLRAAERENGSSSPPLTYLDIEPPLCRDLRMALASAAQEESRRATSGKSVDGMTRAAWRLTVCQTIARLVDVPVPAGMSHRSGERDKSAFRLLLVSACLRVLKMTMTAFMACNEVPYFLRYPQEARSSDLSSVFPSVVGKIVEARDERVEAGSAPATGDEVSAETSAPVRGDRLIANLRVLLRTVGETPLNANAAVHERHLGVLADRAGEILVVRSVEGKSPMALQGSIETLCVATFRACARALGVDEGTFVNDKDCPELLRGPWRKAEELRGRRERIISGLVPLLKGLCSEERKQSKSRSEVYERWYVKALQRLKEVLECGEGLEAVRIACQLILAETSVEMPFFLTQGPRIERREEVDIVPRGISPELRAAMQKPPIQGLSAGPGGRRGGKRIKS